MTGIAAALSRACHVFNRIQLSDHLLAVVRVHAFIFDGVENVALALHGFLDGFTGAKCGSNFRYQFLFPYYIVLANNLCRNLARVFFVSFYDEWKNI